MALFSLCLGGVMLMGGALSLGHAIRRPEQPTRWGAVDRAAAAWDRVGFGSGLLTRGFYLMQIFVGLLGASLLVAGAGELGRIKSQGISWLALSLMFGAAIAAGVALIVARTGKPARWIPPVYRK